MRDDGMSGIDSNEEMKTGKSSDVRNLTFWALTTGIIPLISLSRKSKSRVRQNAMTGAGVQIFF